MEPLQDAIDTFDFRPGLQQLQQLRTHWIDEPTGEPRMTQAPDQRPRLLLVDDEPTNLQVLRHVLQADYRLLFATDGACAAGGA